MIGMMFDFLGHAHHYEFMGPNAAGVAPLPSREAERLLRTHGDELTEPDAPEPVVAAFSARDAAELAEIADLVRAARSALRRRRTSSQQMMEALLPQQQLAVSPGVGSQVRRNAQARAELAEEFGVLSSAEVATRAGSRASNAAALASRWRKERRVFGVPVGDSLRYPGFQFDSEGRPLAVVAEVLAELAEALSPWELALWFTGANGWLGGVRPVDVLTTEPAQVSEAARHLAAEVAS